VALFGVKHWLVGTDENCPLRPDKILEAITSKTQAVVTISPKNPTGAVYSKDLLKQVNDICRQRGIYHISDEAYEYFTYDGVKHVSPASFSDSSEHTISLFSLSKAYGFASWRIGYMVIPRKLFTAVKKVQDTNLICQPVISQYAALGALQAKPEYLKNNILAIAEVREIVIKSLKSLEDVCKFAPADGAFYFFLKVKGQINDFELVKQLINGYKIAVLPGNTFGMNQGCYLRIAYGALQKETVKEGIERLVNGVRNLVKS